MNHNYIFFSVVNPGQKKKKQQKTTTSQGQEITKGKIKFKKIF